MEKIIAELENIVETFSKKFSDIPDEEFSTKPLPHKWSKKEVVGHLIDSGQNNLRRFICGQYEHLPPKIVYDQDFWVRANKYQYMEKREVIELWRLINRQISAVLGSMPGSNFGRSCDTGKETPQLHTLEWLAEDYVKHMKHHLNQVIGGSFNIVYP